MGCFFFWKQLASLRHFFPAEKATHTEPNQTVQVPLGH